MSSHVSNRLLDCLPAVERFRLMAQLEPVSLPVRTELYALGKFPRHMYFITSGMASLVTTMDDGDGVEVGLAGHESLVSSIHLLGPQKGQSQGFMQIGGTGLRMDFRKFQKEFMEMEQLHRLVLRHVQFESLTLAQIAACNRLHAMEERLARWLLMVSDRLGSTTLPLTQEFLGQMLGTRRSTVTLALRILQRAGLIESGRGRIEIQDRDRLKEAACECYAVTERLLTNIYS